MLQVSVPDLLEKSIECHGNEEKCAKAYMDERKEYAPKEKSDTIALFKQWYQDYPPPLHRAALQESFGKVIEEKILPSTTAKGKGLILATPEDEQTGRYLVQDDTLVITVQLKVIDDTKPHIALLIVSFYSKNVSPFNQPRKKISPWDISVIPLDLPSEVIARRVAEFIEDYHALNGSIVRYRPSYWNSFR